MSQPAEPRGPAGATARPLGVVRLPAEPASVPQARRFVREALAAHDPELVDRSEACISELVTNAVLHARTELHVHVEDLGEAIRLEVRDRSTAMPRRLVHTVRSATGRGMEMVGLLARSWGVDLLEGDAKSVWCELLAGHAHDDAGTVDVDALLDAWPDDDDILVGPWDGEVEPVLPSPRPPSELEVAAAAAPGAVRIRLERYPVRLGVRAAEHTRGVLRECALLAQGAAATHAPGRLVDLARVLTTSYSGELAAIDEQRTAALMRGEDALDLVYPPVTTGREVVVAWQGAMEALDAYAESSALLSLATPPLLVALRTWMVDEMLRQLAGGPPHPWTGPLDLD